MVVRFILSIILLAIAGVSGWYFSLHQHPLPAKKTIDNVSVPSLPNNMQQDKSIHLIETFHSPALFVKQLAGDRDAGRKIFREFCATCHAKTPVIEMDAPRLDDKKAWQLRRKMGVDALLTITVNGAGAMPARGGCFECSDEQLRETIQYMLEQAD